MLIPAKDETEFHVCHSQTEFGNEECV